MAAYAYAISESAEPQTIHSTRIILLDSDELSVAQVTKLVSADETFSIIDNGETMQIYHQRLETPEEVGVRVTKAKWYNARRQDFLLKNKRL